MVGSFERVFPPPIEARASVPEFPMPELKAWPLPPFLVRSIDPNLQEDYFDDLQTTEVGALVWSTFPVRVYLEPPDSNRRSQVWVREASKAVQDWATHFPLTIVSQPEQAEITIWRSPLPLRVSNRQTGRVRSAETRYELYTTQDASTGRKTLQHRMFVRVRPDQADSYIRSAVRHELGHALGIWGHSPQESDIMYFAQVRNPPPISRRDLNTLKRVYEQPTRLGGFLP
ncbi:MAG: peptidase [Leptolyngbyaceae cyanobacterium bins.59]|nr:peptidase [Leptolyngbyaceae cyanobacterium bins.59]